jgi:hypothetical protein
MSIIGYIVHFDLIFSIKGVGGGNVDINYIFEINVLSLFF